MSTVYFTICARNYLGYALTCRASLLAAEPDARFVVYLADEAPDAPPEGVEIVTAADLGFDDLEDLAFKYSILEFNTAIKPACFHHAFNALGAATAVYLDPDIQVFAPLQIAQQVGPALAPAMLTPHAFTPPPADGRTPTMADLEASGRYNLGFLALAAHPQTRAFLAWWRERCETEGYNAPERGLFVDQKFVDRATDFMPDAIVQTDPGWNVAYWNLHERRVERTDSGLTAGGAALVFFHFSGVIPGDPSVLSKHQTRFDAASAGQAVAGLVRAYLELLKRNGHPDWAATPYAYGAFEDGTPIPDAARRLIARRLQTRPDGRPRFAARHAVCNALVSAPVSAFDAPMTALMAEIRAMRPDLQTAFDTKTAAGRRGFARWFLRHGADALRMPDVFIEPVRRGLSGASARLAAAEAGAARLARRA